MALSPLKCLVLRRLVPAKDERDASLVGSQVQGGRAAYAFTEFLKQQRAVT
jgi:hypothetical protein